MTKIDSIIQFVVVIAFAEVIFAILIMTARWLYRQWWQHGELLMMSEFLSEDGECVIALPVPPKKKKRNGEQMMTLAELFDTESIWQDHDVPRYKPSQETIKW